MRLKAMFKIFLLLMVDAFVLIALFGYILGGLILLGIFLYTWLGEYVSLKSDQAVKLQYLNPFEQEKLSRVRQALIRHTREKKDANIENIQFYVIPTEEINAYSYGPHSIAATSQLLQTSDELTLTAVLAHEVSHSLNCDAFISRLLFASIVYLVAFFSLLHAFFIFIILIIFLILDQTDILDIIIFKGITTIVRWCIHAIQYIIYFIYRIIESAISRKCEYRADHYAVELGYGYQLSYFLQMYVGNYPVHRLSDLLYSSHPQTDKRIAHIEEAQKQINNTMILHPFF